MKFLRETVRPGETVVSNLPAHVAWYAGAAAVALPNRPEDIEAMSKARPLRYLYLSFLNIGTLGDMPRWLKMLVPTHEPLLRWCGEKGYRVARVFKDAGVVVDLAPQSESPSRRETPDKASSSF
jgi:hypothetical protein